MPCRLLFLPQLFPTHLRRCLQVLSPNKSISGLVGGLLLGTATAALIGFFRPIYFEYTTLPAHDCSMYTLVGFGLSVLAICGDLLESFVKRVAQLKVRRHYSIGTRARLP
jgi:CDP-diglyceride synthetase